MATLQGRAIKDTFKDLLQVSNTNNGVDGTLRTIEDGEGTSSALQVSTGAVKVNGTLDVTGAVTGVPHVDYQGNYSSSTSYVKDDVVVYNGSSYIAKGNTTGNAPTNVTYWGVLASKGTDGVNGTNGSDGATGPQGPQGAQGPAGNDGADGADGANGTDFPITPVNYISGGTNSSLIGTPTVRYWAGVTQQTTSSLSYSRIQLVGRQVFASGYIGFTSGSYALVGALSSTLGSGIQVDLPVINSVRLEANSADIIGSITVQASNQISQGTSWANWIKPVFSVVRSWGGSPNSVKLCFPQDELNGKYIASVNWSLNYLLSDNVTLP